ncbi:MAG: hypothetical protein CME70_11995 [Halobacteriovorax sp.]|nr:hypothetical protein [Halobacteriovorax sp.]|tara:strand:+ start:316232 stop:316555 length:324 start_codon:yes stop_codon:yes gene_type:complete
MKKFIAIAAALLSLSAFAGNLDKTEIVWLKGETAQGVFAKAEAMATEINGDRWGKTKFSYLSQCNPTSSDFEDSHSFNRKAYTSTSRVTFNHVTGVYGATVVVRCED